MQTFIFLSCLLLAAQGYNILANPDAGDFTVFPLVNLGTGAFPTCMAFSPDGRIFIGQKNGMIKVVDANGNLQAGNWIDLSDRVNNAGDKGLTAIVLHPDFPKTPYLYATYPIWQSDSHDLNRVTQGVVGRYTENNGASSPSTELLIVGRVNGTGFPSCHNSHVTGDLVFGTDGTLFASAGEGSHWDAVDDGTDFPFDPYDWQCAPFFGAINDIGSFRAQHLTNIGGKVIRIDPLTGNGIGSTNFPNLVSNPFFDSQNPSSAASVTWSYGHRNPWKLRLRADSPAPGTLYIAEVGAKDYEEINVVKPSDRGSNYGWPCQTANRRQQPWFTNTATPTEYYVPRYPTNQNTIDMCAALQPNLTNTKIPILYYSRSQYVYGEQIGIIGNCASGLSFYNGSSYPSAYRMKSDGSRSLFISDFGNQWIKVIRVDGNDQFIPSLGVQDFLDNVGTILTMTPSPVDGDLYYITEEGEINRIRYTAGYVGAPIVVASSNVTTLNMNNRAANFQFSSDGTFDPASLPITFSWTFGDNSSSTLPNPSHTYTSSGVFTVTLTVTNSAGYFATQSFKVATNNDAPTAKIAGAQWFQFDSGQSVTLTATFNDDITPANQLQWQWEYRLVHNNHYHPGVLTIPSVNLGTGSSSSTGGQVLSSLISVYERNTLEIYATAYDASGVSTRTKVIGVPNLPNNANYGNTAPVANFTTEQKGSSVYFDGGVSFDFDIDYLYYSWIWGDGTNGTGMVNHHTYSNSGTYVVSLTVVDPWQATSTYTHSVDYVAPAGVTSSGAASSSSPSSTNGGATGDVASSSTQATQTNANPTSSVAGGQTTQVDNDPQATQSATPTSSFVKENSGSAALLVGIVPLVAVLLM